ncbi:porin family protein [Flavobacteriales bacterium]|nr:porin family protein [Flavobacteriales bacterium]
MRALILLAIFSIITALSFGQESKPKKFYLETIGGYGFPLVNDDLGSTNELIGIADRLVRADSSISIKPAQGTQGPGWQFSVNAGYMFHPNIGVEAQISYLKSNPILIGRSVSPTYRAEHLVIGERIDIAPQLVFNFQFKEKWSVYSKSGVIIPIWGRSSSEITIEDQEGRVFEQLIGIPNPSASASVSIKASTFGKFSYGFQTRLGAGYSVLDWLTVFGEVKFVALTIRSKEDRADEINVQFYNSQTGEPGLLITEDDLDEIEKRTVYLNELTENSNNPEVNPNSDSSKPLEGLMRKDNFNQLAISFGLRFYLR